MYIFSSKYINTFFKEKFSLSVSSNTSLQIMTEKTSLDISKLSKVSMDILRSLENQEVDV